MSAETDLGRLTLVVPTYNRQEFTLRLINYWSDKGPRLIVLDGSARPIKSKTLDGLGLHIQYFHQPIGMYQRLLESLNFIQTEFVALAGDDEFYVPSAVEACIVELDNDAAMVACCGRALGFTPKSQMLIGRTQYPLLEKYAVDSDLSEMRVSQHMRYYVPSLIYAICRTQQWKASWKYILSKEFPAFAIGELQFEMCMSYAGKSKVISELMWLRSNNENKPVHGTDPSLNPTKRFPHWWRNTENVIEYEEFISIMTKAFAELKPNGSNDTRSVVIDGVEAYLDFVGERANARNMKSVLRNVAAKVIPESLKPHIKALLQGLCHSYKCLLILGLNE